MRFVEIAHMRSEIAQIRADIAHSTCVSKQTDSRNGSGHYAKGVKSLLL